MNAFPGDLRRCCSERGLACRSRCSRFIWHPLIDRLIIRNPRILLKNASAENRRKPAAVIDRCRRSLQGGGCFKKESQRGPEDSFGIEYSDGGSSDAGPMAQRKPNIKGKKNSVG